MKRKRSKRKKIGRPKDRKIDVRTQKRTWIHALLIFSGFTLILFFIFNLSLAGVLGDIRYSQEFVLLMLTLLTFSFIAKAYLRMKGSTIYEIFYSYYITLTLLILTIIYWIAYLNNLKTIGIFQALIVLIHIIVFLYSIITLGRSNRIQFILISYVFIAAITIIVFAYMYWTTSLLGLGHLQFSECDTIKPELKSENWFYFSSETFYSLGYGDICPVLAPARFISQLEVAFGAIINTILIGFIFWRIREKTMEDEIDMKTN